MYEEWNQWEGSHDSEDAKKRIASAKKANLTPAAIDKENGTGEFVGSAKYHVSLDFCNCSDFRKRKLPCKHMYRLAIELGLMDESAESDRAKIRVAKGERWELPEAVEKVEQLDDIARNLLRGIMKDIIFGGVSAVVVPKMPESSRLILDGFLTISDAKLYRVENRSKHELVSRLQGKGIEFNEKLKKAELAEWIKLNVDLESLFDDEYTVTLNSGMEGCQKNLYSYLLRRDEDESFYNLDADKFETRPFGSDFRIKNGKQVLTFPDDQITFLLNKHNKNRLAE